MDESIFQHKTTEHGEFSLMHRRFMFRLILLSMLNTSNYIHSHSFDYNQVNWGWFEKNVTMIGKQSFFLNLEKIKIPTGH